MKKSVFTLVLLSAFLFNTQEIKPTEQVTKEAIFKKVVLPSAVSLIAGIAVLPYSFKSSRAYSLRDDYALKRYASEDQDIYSSKPSWTYLFRDDCALLRKHYTWETQERFFARTS